jgi:hypothetical protein
VLRKPNTVEALTTPKRFDETIHSVARIERGALGVVRAVGNRRRTTETVKVGRYFELNFSELAGGSR